MSFAQVTSCVVGAFILVVASIVVGDAIFGSESNFKWRRQIKRGGMRSLRH